MVNCIAVCGDSFATGAGLNPEIAFEKSFGGLVAEELDLPLKVYARSGCCNYTIYLQVKKILEQKKEEVHNPLVLITLTNHNRLFMPIGHDFNHSEIPDLSMVDYRSYHPYSLRYSNPLRPLHFRTNAARFCSETVSNIDLAVVGKMPGTYEFMNLIKEKTESVKSYIVDLYHSGAKEEQDAALAALMHLQLKKSHTPHIIMGQSRARFDFIDQRNFADNNWGELIQLYPDEYDSMHCNEEGHRVVKENIIKQCRDLIT